MTRYILALLAILTITPVTALADGLNQSAISNPTPLDLSSVIIRGTDDVGRAIGGGVIIAQAPNGVVTILTASHVVTKRDLTVQFEDGDIEHPFGISHEYLRSKDDQYDLAVIHVSTIHRYPVAALRQSALTLGEHLTLVGQPADGKPYTHSNVVIAAIINGIPIFTCDNTCSAGDSGGGIFDANGNLVTILYASAFVHPDAAPQTTVQVWIANSLEHIHSFLASAN